MPKKPADKKPTTTAAKAIESRWTKSLADAGWTALPNVVLEKQAVLGLKPTDVNIILQIAKFWWQPGQAPYPSVKRVAEAMGVTPRTVQKRISKMVEAGLLEREERFYSQGGQTSNCYTFNGLIERCKPFAKEIIAERKRKAATAKALVRRKEPLGQVQS